MSLLSLIGALFIAGFAAWLREAERGSVVWLAVLALAFFIGWQGLEEVSFAIVVVGFAAGHAVYRQSRGEIEKRRIVAVPVESDQTGSSARRLENADVAYALGLLDDLEHMQICDEAGRFDHARALSTYRERRDEIDALISGTRAEMKAANEKTKQQIGLSE